MGNCYNTGLRDIVDGSSRWDGTPDLRVMLLDSSHSFDADNDFVSDIVANEISNPGYIRTALAGENVVVDDANDEIQLDATDTTFISLGAGTTPAFAVVFRNTGADGTSQLLTTNQLTSPPVPDGSDYEIQWNAEGVLEIANL